MKAKLLALAAVLLPLCLARPLALPHRDARTNEAEAALFPPAVGGYQLSRRIVHRFDGRSYREELAQYSLPRATTVQLGALVGDRFVHNGIGCHLARGETLVSEALQPVPTRTAAATFDVALARDGEALVLIANTACFSDHCGGDRLGDWTGSWHDLHPRTLFLEQKPVVPVTLELRRDDVAEADSAAAQASLTREFLAFAAQLDLAPMRALAAAQ